MVIDGERLQLHMFVTRFVGAMSGPTFGWGAGRAAGTTTSQPAVLRVLLGRERLENSTFIAQHSHYGFDSFCASPASRVPTRRAAWRANRPVPAADAVPRAASLAWLNEIIVTARSGGMSTGGSRPRAETRRAGAAREVAAAELAPAPRPTSARCCRAGWTRWRGSVCGRRTARCRSPWPEAGGRESNPRADGDCHPDPP